MEEEKESETPSMNKAEKGGIKRKRKPLNGDSFSKGGRLWSSPHQIIRGRELKL